MPNNKNPKRQEGENSAPSATSSSAAAARAVEQEDDDESTTIIPTTKRISRTFDEAKANTRRAIENYAAAVSNTTDATVAAIRICNNVIYANTEAIRLSLAYNRDNAREMSRVFVSTAKQLEKI